MKKGTGMMYVHKTGDIAYYCSNSCFKNHVFIKRKMSKKLAPTQIKNVKQQEKK
jgi:ribosomal protein L24E